VKPGANPPRLKTRQFPKGQPASLLDLPSSAALLDRFRSVVVRADLRTDQIRCPTTARATASHERPGSNLPPPPLPVTGRGAAERPRTWHRRHTNTELNAFRESGELGSSLRPAERTRFHVPIGVRRPPSTPGPERRRGAANLNRRATWATMDAAGGLHEHDFSSTTLAAWAEHRCLGWPSALHPAVGASARPTRGGL